MIPSVPTSQKMECQSPRWCLRFDISNVAYCISTLKPIISPPFETWFLDGTFCEIGKYVERFQHVFSNVVCCILQNLYPAQFIIILFFYPIYLTPSPFVVWKYCILHLLWSFLVSLLISCMLSLKTNFKLISCFSHAITFCFVFCFR